MAALMIVALVGLSAWLGIRLQSAVVENSSLRANVASLKRRLDQS